MRILVIHFSFTSHVGKLAQDIAAELRTTGEVTCAIIEPQVQRTVWNWLARSFVPGWRVPIRPVIADLTSYDLVCLGFPKWTFNCPPVNEYVRLMRCRPGQELALFMSYGGFDQERYLTNMVRKVSRRGARVVATLAVQRRIVRQGGYTQELKLFCRDSLGSVRT